MAQPENKQTKQLLFGKETFLDNPICIQLIGTHMSRMDFTLDFKMSGNVLSVKRERINQCLGLSENQHALMSIKDIGVYKMRTDEQM